MGDEIPFEALGLPAEALLDPFDGQPLRTKGRGKDLVVYSVGMNFKDDGGIDLSGRPSGDFGWGPSKPEPAK